MYHKHFNTIDSTQIYLKENLDQLQILDHDILISCSKQTEGVGRKGNTWDFYPNSLAVSFTLKPSDNPTLTPIEIALMTVNFIKKKFKVDLFLKWPNDILTSEGKKCGGILCLYIDKNTLIAGLGLNLGKIDHPENHDYPHGLGAVDQNLELNPLDQEVISKELYTSLLINRMTNKEIKIAFNKCCFHINKDVLIYEDGKEHIGIFRGIGDNGEALVEINSTIRPFLSSSLTILN